MVCLANIRVDDRRNHCADKYRVVASHSTHSGQSSSRYVGQRLEDQPLGVHTVVKSSVTPPAPHPHLSPSPPAPSERVSLASLAALIHEVQAGRPLVRVEGARDCRFGRKGFLQQIFPGSDSACLARAHVTVGVPRCVRPPAIFGAAPGGGEGGSPYRHLRLQYVRGSVSGSDRRTYESGRRSWKTFRRLMGC